MHPRTVIRDAIKAALLHQTAAEERVVSSRKQSRRQEALPAIGIYTPEEQTDPASVNTAPRTLDLILPVMVEVVIEVDEHVDNELDAVAEQVETALEADLTLGGLIKTLWPSKTTLDVMEDARRTVGVLQMTYQVEYQRESPRLNDASLDDLSTVAATFDLDGSGPAPQASALVASLETE